MRKQFLVINLLFMAEVLFAQNIGIGTLTPAFRLDVKNGSVNTDSLTRMHRLRLLATRPW